MATIILRPVSMFTIGSWTAFPSGATLLEALSDGDDGTWARSPQIEPQQTVDYRVSLTVPGPSLPAGARVAQVRAHARVDVEMTSGTADSVNATFSVDGRVQASLWVTEALQTVTGPWMASRPSGRAWDDGGDVEAAFTFVRVPYGSVAYGRVYDVWVEVEYHERPEVTVTAPPLTVTDTTRPTIRWDYSQVDGLPQSQWRAFVGDGSAVVWESGWRYGTASEVQIPVDLNGGQQYWAGMFVRAQWGGEGHLQSPFEERPFTLDLDTPAAPDVVVTPQPDDARTLVEIAPVAGDVDTGWFSVQHRDSDDGPWVTLRAGGHLDATDGPVAIFDHETPFNVARTYRVRGHAEVGAEQVASPPTDVTAMLELEGRWLTDPRDPAALNMEVSTREHSRTLQGREVVHTPAGMDIAVVESEPPTLQQTLSVWALDPQEHATLYAALRSTRTLLYRDWRSTVYFRWVGDRTAQQWAKDFHDIDAMSGTMVQVARPAP